MLNLLFKPGRICPTPAAIYPKLSRGLPVSDALAMDYSTRGENQMAKETLGTLLTLWKDADPGLPLLAQAKSAYSKLP